MNHRFTTTAICLVLCCLSSCGKEDGNPRPQADPAAQPAPAPVTDDDALRYDWRAVGPGAPGGLYRSRDRGDRWERIFPHPRYCRVDYHPTDPTVLFCGAGVGLQWSLDSGATWQPAEGLPFKREVTRTTVDPRYPDRIWVTTWGGGVWTGMFR